MILTSKIIRFIIGSKQNVSDTIYECGEPSIEGSWKRIPIAYFKIALIFILFDIELVFIFPWIITLDNPTQLSYLSFITLPDNPNELIFSNTFLAGNFPLEYK